jgi:hypothetical protein
MNTKLWLENPKREGVYRSPRYGWDIVIKIHVWDVLCEEADHIEMAQVR